MNLEGMMLGNSPSKKAIVENFKNDKERQLAELPEMKN